MQSLPDKSRSQHRGWLILNKKIKISAMNKMAAIPPANNNFSMTNSCTRCRWTFAWRDSTNKSEMRLSPNRFKPISGEVLLGTLDAPKFEDCKSYFIKYVYLQFRMS